MRDARYEVKVRYEWNANLLPLCEHILQHTVWYELRCDHVCRYLKWDDIIVEYEGGNNGPPHSGIVAKYMEVDILVVKAEYQDAIAHLEVKREIGFRKSAVRLMVRRVSIAS